MGLRVVLTAHCNSSGQSDKVRIGIKSEGLLGLFHCMTFYVWTFFRGAVKNAYDPSQPHSSKVGLAVVASVESLLANI